LNFIELLQGLGINGAQIGAIVGSIIGRMAGVCSELATYNWLKTQSGLGELIDTDYEALPLMTMYRAADTLWKHNALIERVQLQFKAGEADGTPKRLIFCQNWVHR